MTTHLHADKLPLTDTPYTDQKELENKNQKHETKLYYALKASRKLERDKRTAEAQLAVALKMLERISFQENEKNTTLEDWAEEAITEIKAIGGGE
jgi:hypothetical protein